MRMPGTMIPNRNPLTHKCHALVLGVLSIVLHTYKSPSVNFINILLSKFLYKSALRSFLYLRFSFVIFGTKILAQKGRIKR